MTLTDGFSENNNGANSKNIQNNYNNYIQAVSSGRTYKFSTGEDQDVAMVSQLFHYLEDQATSSPRNSAPGTINSNNRPINNSDEQQAGGSSDNNNNVPVRQSNGVVRNSDELIEPVNDEAASFRQRTTTIESRCETDNKNDNEKGDGNPGAGQFLQLKPSNINQRRRSTLVMPNNNNANETRSRRGTLLRPESVAFQIQDGNGASNNNSGANRRQDQYISRLFYEEEASDAKPSGRAIDMFSLTILKKLFCKLGIEDMYQLYSRRQFCSHMRASLVLLGLYNLLVLIVCTSYFAPGVGREDHKNADSHRYLVGKIMLSGTMFAASIVFLIGASFQHIYANWSGFMSVVFLLLYGLHCLAEPWIEAAFYHSMFDPAPNLLHFIFTAYAMLPIGTSTSLIASISLSILSVTNQICVFVYAYQAVEDDALEARRDGNFRQPEEGVVNEVISLCLLYMAAIVIGVYLKVFCTELTYRQTFYNTRQFIETELLTSIENEINKSIKEALIHKILPDYLIRDIIQQIETMKHFQPTGAPGNRGGVGNNRSVRAVRNRRVSIEDGRSTVMIMNEPKSSDFSSGSLGSESKLLKLNIQKHTGVTILFADIVKFVVLTKTLTPSQLVETLHDLYSRFDHLSTRFHCQRTKLIGDCYKCVSGLNTEKNSSHAVDAVWMGLNMALEIENVAMFRSVPQLKMRIGVHSGFVFAGILGLKKWQFDVWSDDVDIANALETEGRPGFVHASEATVKNLPEGVFNLEPVTQYPNAVGIRSRDLLAKKSIRSYIVTRGTKLDPGIIARQLSLSRAGRSPDTGLLSPTATVSMLPLRAPSTLSDFGTTSHRSGSDSGITTGNFRGKVRKMAKRALFGDIFVTNASGIISSNNNNNNNNEITTTFISPGLPPQSPDRQLSWPTHHFPENHGEAIALTCTPSSDNPIGNFISTTRQFSRQLQISPQEKETEINRRLKSVFVLDGASNSANGDDLKTTNFDRARLQEIQSEMNSIAMTFKNLRLERVYKQHRDDPFQLAIVVSYLTFLIITAIIRLNKLEGANEAVTSAISSVTTLMLGLAVFFFTICGFSNKLMTRLRAFLRSNFARSVGYVSCMAILYCNAFMPFYLCSALDEKKLVEILPNACKLCDINDNDLCKNTDYPRSEMRAWYPPIVNFEEAMTLNETEKGGFCPDSYLFGDMTLLLVFVTAIFSRIPFLIRYLVIIIGNLVFLFFAFLLKPHAFTAYDLCAVQHLFSENGLEFKLYYTTFQFFFFLNLLVMCYQQEKNNRLDFLLRDGARKKGQELRKKLAQNSALLENILPSHVIQWYITNESGMSELYVCHHERVCILFVKVTNYTFEGEQVEVMRALNEITAAFDNLLDLPEYSTIIEKIKINQTMFMYAAGLDNRDNRRFDEAALTLLEFAATLFEVLQRLNEQTAFPYKLQAGLHCGSVVAGVIGSSMPLYDILGDTVNVASRLESCHQDGFIHVLSQLNEIYHDECGIDYYKKITVEIKGLGTRTVYIYVPQKVIDFMKGIKQELNKK